MRWKHLRKLNTSSECKSSLLNSWYFSWFEKKISHFLKINETSGPKPYTIITTTTTKKKMFTSADGNYYLLGPKNNSTLCYDSGLVSINIRGMIKCWALKHSAQNFFCACTSKYEHL